MRRIIGCSILIICFHFSYAQTQGLTKEIKRKGTLTVTIYVETGDFNAEGDLVSKSIEETNYTTDQVLVLHPNKYKLLKSNPKQLQAYSKANASFVLNEEQELGKVPAMPPINFHQTYKKWSLCDGENLRLVQDDISSGTLQNHHTGIRINLHPGDSQEKIIDDEMLSKAMDALENQYLAKKRSDDLKAGKEIREEDYFKPASLPSASPIHIYFFTYSGPGISNAFLKDFGVIGQSNVFDCEINAWREPEIIKPKLLSNISPEINPERRINRRYWTVGQHELDILMNDPKAHATLVGGSTEYEKNEFTYFKCIKSYKIQVY